jgi:hypothetical protein
MNQEINNYNNMSLNTNENNNKIISKTTTLKSTNNEQIKTSQLTHSDLNKLLENEITANHNNVKTWNKLDKMTRIEKLYNYVDSIKTTEELTQKDCVELKAYLRTCIDRKKLGKSKEVIYDKETGEIKSLPVLQIVKKGTKKFTLKQTDKKDSTLKNLPSTKVKRVKKNESKIIQEAQEDK